MHFKFYRFSHTAYRNKEYCKSHYGVFKSNNSVRLNVFFSSAIVYGYEHEIDWLMFYHNIYYNKIVMN
jgi:hypothetical protein